MLDKKVLVRVTNGWVLLFWGLFLLFCFNNNDAFAIQKQLPSVVDGVLDLRGFQLQIDTRIELKGKWKYYWNELRNTAPHDKYLTSDHIQIPSTWSHHQAKDGEKLPGYGTITLHLKILTDKTLAGKRVFISFPRMLHSSAIYLAQPNQTNPILIFYRGKVALSPENFEPDSRGSIVDFELAETNELFVQISNYIDANNSGIVKTPILGYKQAVLRYEGMRRQKDSAVFGIIVAIGLLMLLLYLFRRSEKGPLWLAVFCFVIATRVLAINRYLDEMFAGLNLYQVFFKINYLTMTFSVMSYIGFLMETLPETFKNRFFRWSILISLLYSIIIVIFPQQFFSSIINYFFLIMAIIFATAIYLYLRTLIRKFDVFTLLLFLGSLSMIVFAFIEILSRAFWTVEYNATPYGLIFNILFMGIVVSLSNAMARRESERLAETLTKEVTVRQNAEKELNRINVNLENLVTERTKDLESAYKKIVETAHKAGMAEIAANTLHNVGNVLNSLSTSANLIKDDIRLSPLENYQRANSLLREHLDDFAEYIKSDPNGRKLLEYFLELETSLCKTFSGIQENTDRLCRKADSIRTIITSQKHMVGEAALVEKLDMKDIIEESLSLLPDDFYNDDIKINKTYGEIPPIPVQKSKLVHVLVNLFTNAYHALTELNSNQKILNICLNSNEKEAWITVEDTGKGITKENLEKIFNHGFTTKEKGFGFGLHSSALYMQEMGGNITAKSDGEGYGTTFTLIFPLDYSK